MSKINKDYDSEPVEYCLKCYSLKIKHEDSLDIDCCCNCGSTEIGETDIDTWEKLYEKRYGHKYVEKPKTAKDSIFFKMSIERLKTKLYHHKAIRAIIYSLYPNFPKGYSKADMVILLFDKLAKDNRINDLRYLLFDYSNKK